MAKPKRQSAASCPCESGRSLAECCGPIVAGERDAVTAEALMRSRYTAYVIENEAYLLSSWHPSTRPRSVAFEPGQKWLGLTIKSVEAGGEDDDEGVVEFVARFRQGNTAHRMHERSRFSRVLGRWHYVDGEFPD